MTSDQGTTDDAATIAALRAEVADFRFANERVTESLADTEDALRAAEARAVAAEAKVARVEALHAPFRILAPCAADGCDRDDCAEGDEPGIPVHWLDVLYYVCDECKDDEGERVDYPCPTRAALADPAEVTP
jgi:hypothetical protein